MALETSKNSALTETTLKNAFREYYFKFAKKIEVPNRIKEREFGFARFEGMGMVRHQSFSHIGELVGALIMETPSDVYCSNSYYRFPRLAMKEKQWLGADLIFDIDGKDLDLECVPSHSYRLCKNCDKISPPPITTNVCSHCNSDEVDQVSIPCHKCIHASRKQVKHLQEILTNELGIDNKGIDIYFSGNNGFHVLVKNNEFVAYDSQMRSEIISYVLGKGLMPEFIGVRKDGLKGNNIQNGFRIKIPPGTYPYGWRSRVARELRLKSNDPSEERLRNIVVEKGGYQGFKEEIDRITRRLASLIDHNVTVDIHRVFRMPGTINSKSSLIKTKCDDIDTFDPFADACFLGDHEIKLTVKAPINLRLKKRNFKVEEGPTSLPTYAAAYLFCKGLAEAT